MSFFVVAILIALMPDVTTTPLDSKAAAIARWDALEKAVLWGKSSKTDGFKELTAAIAHVNALYKDDIPADTKSEWCFPVAGGQLYDVGGFGDGYHPDYPKPAYSFWDGNKHGGHPGHDVFIHDKDIDCIDDKSGEAVNMLSISHGVVLSINTVHSFKKPRGGIYAWIYHPSSGMFYYYAHMRDIFVKPGDIVTPCQAIGTVGATGYIASKKYPCHLHLMLLKYAGGAMKPYDPYPDFKAIFAKKKTAGKKSGEKQ